MRRVIVACCFVALSVLVAHGLDEYDPNDPGESTYWGGATDVEARRAQSNAIIDIVDGLVSNPVVDPSNGVRFADGSSILPGAQSNQFLFISADGDTNLLNSVDTNTIQAIEGGVDSNAATAAGAAVLADRNENNITINRFWIEALNAVSAQTMVDGYADGFQDESGIDGVLTTGGLYSAGDDAFLWSYTDQAIANNAYRWFKMNDDGASPAVVDAIAASNGVASKNTDAMATNGLVNGALYFTDDDSMSWGKDAAVSPTGAWTGSLWVKLDPSYSGTVAIQSRDNGGAQRDNILQYSYSANKTTFWQWDANNNAQWSEYNIDMEDNAWHNIMFGFDGTNIFTKVDGNFGSVGGSAPAVPLRVSGVTNMLGWSQSAGAGEDYHGAIDMVMLWDGYLDPALQDLVYNSGSGTETNTEIVTDYSMSLVSTSFPAVSEPAMAKVLLVVEDTGVTPNVINDDVKAFATKDDGTNWVAVTLEDVGTYTPGKSVWAGTNTLAGSGTNMRWKVNATNGTQGALNAGAIHWK